mmetsp:Transcript_26197/g.44194  ORF Transcript_26197/g.44194 Transcript_26197/m.44194 type:complete len:358 (+) Transcript_26197:2109-3182(+)
MKLRLISIKVQFFDTRRDNPDNIDIRFSMKEDDDDERDEGMEGGMREVEVREQDRFLPIANIARIMKTELPGNAKIAKDAKESIQECVSEFISFITSEASDKCLQEKRKTINGDDILWAMSTLGFDKYIDPLKVYLSKYRDSVKGEKPEKKQSAASLKKEQQSANTASTSKIATPYIAQHQQQQNAAMKPGILQPPLQYQPAPSIGTQQVFNPPTGTAVATNLYNTSSNTTGNLGMDMSVSNQLLPSVPNMATGYPNIQPPLQLQQQLQQHPQEQHVGTGTIGGNPMLAGNSNTSATGLPLTSSVENYPLLSGVSSSTAGTSVADNMLKRPEPPTAVAGAVAGDGNVDDPAKKLRTS